MPGSRIYGRPIVDYDRTKFTTDEAGTRIVDSAKISAFLFKTISGPADHRKGWEPISFTVAKPPRRTVAHCGGFKSRSRRRHLL